jgi:uncharacterized membrane protein YhaH (DUF805 family)
VDGYRNAMHRYGEFAGRTSRRRYWIFLSFLLSGTMGAAWLDRWLGWPDGGMALPLFLAVHFVPFLSSTARRLRDAGWNSRWMILLLAPYLGVAIVFALAARPSVPDVPDAGKSTSDEGWRNVGSTIRIRW